MSDEEIAKAEKRGYGRGYSAGKARRFREINRERVQREHQAFLERAFIAALPACIEVTNWKRGTTPITGMDDRVRLAWEIAEAALRLRRYA